MESLRPSESFGIVWLVSDPADTTAYYVQAKIYNSRTNVLLSTVNLTNSGGGRYQNTWSVPGDSSGQGFYVDIKLNVYTDSGYTVPSSNYAQENRVYLVQERLNANRMGGGGGGVDIDYKKISKIIDDAVGKISIPNYDSKLKEIYDCIELVKEHAVEMEKTMYDGSEMKGMMGEHKSLVQKISSALEEVKQMQDTSQEQVLMGIHNLTDSVGSVESAVSAIPLDQITAKVSNVVQSLEGSLQEIKGSVEQADNTVNSLVEAFSTVETIRIGSGLPIQKGKEKPKEQPKENNFSDLAKLLAQG